MKTSSLLSSPNEDIGPRGLLADSSQGIGVCLEQLNGMEVEVYLPLPSVLALPVHMADVYMSANKYLACHISH
jgi:hypothetical protein